MPPPFPTAIACPSGSMSTPLSVVAGAPVGALQVAPAVAVTRMSPLLPTATARIASAAATEYRLDTVPLACTAHVAPPSVVWMIAPLVPTDHRFDASAATTLRSEWGVFEVWATKVTPSV